MIFLVNKKEPALNIMHHRHRWQHFDGWGNRAWRCTSAKTVAQLKHLCEGECKFKHHFDELGCGATLVKWHKRGKFFFCAPGTAMVELDHPPTTMIIDDEYLDNVALVGESLKRLSA